MHRQDLNTLIIENSEGLQVKNYNKTVNKFLYLKAEGEKDDDYWQDQELHQIAHRQLVKSWSVDTICATVLVNEAYIKLVNSQQVSFSNRAHFFAIAATAMRQIIINYAQQKQTKKRGDGWQKVTYEEAFISDQQHPELLLSVSYALDEVEAIDPDLARLVEMRFFAGMTEAEIAAIMGVTDRTVRRNWKKAKALLMHALSE